MVTLYNAVSEDGFIARKDGSEDFISDSGKSILITSGPSLNTAALQAGIIDRIKLNVVPVMIGDGIPVFNAKPVLALISTDDRPAGRKLYTHKIVNEK